MQMVNCLIQVLMGAVSGYYTNKLAISHLFTDIPLPGGNSWKAVIKKGGNKEQLAEDLSEIAQDKILGTSVEEGGKPKKDSYFYQELSKKETEDALSQCVEEIFKELSESSIAKKTLAEVVSDMLKQDRGQYRLLEHSLLTAAGDLTLGDLIGEKAFTEFCGELWQGQFGLEDGCLQTAENLKITGSLEKTDRLQKTGGLEAFLEQALLELSEGEKLTLEAVFGKECCEQAEHLLTEKICNIFGETLYEQENADKQDGMDPDVTGKRKLDGGRSLQTESERLKLEGHLQSICRQLGFGTIVRNFLVSLREKTVGDLLSSEGEVWLSEKLCAFLDEPQIQENLKKLFAVLVEKIKQEDWRLSDLLPEGCLEQEGFLEMLKEQLQNLQPFAAVFYEENEEFLAERLKSELSAVIDEGTGNFIQNMVLFSAKDMILEKLEEFLKEKMPGKLEQFFADPSEEVCREICGGISQIRVAGLVDKITFEQALLFLKKACLFGKEKTGISSYVIKNIRKLSLASVLSYDTIDFLSKKADGLLMDMISEWLKGTEKKEQIEAVVHFLFGKLITKQFCRQEAETLSKAFREKHLAEKISDWFCGHFAKKEASLDGETDGTEKLLEYGKERKQQQILSWVYEQISGIALRDMLEQFLPKPQVLLEGLMENYGKRVTVGDLISSVPKEPLKKKIYGKFLEKAADYLPIKGIVKEQVQAMDEDTLCTMMQKFMGTQLKPLNRIGGALGAVVGFLVWAVNPSMEMSLPTVLAAVVSYGLIGIVTNVLALRGLFRPYHIEERSWLGRFAKKDGILSGAVMGIYHVFSKIPGVRNLFCLGYLPEHKEMIAERLAEFVAGNFLQPKDLLPEIVIKPEMVRGFLQEHKDKIAEKAAEALRKADRNQIVAMIEKGISNGDFAEALTGKIKTLDLSFAAEKVYPQFETCREKPLGTYLDSETMAAFMTDVLQKQAGNIAVDFQSDLKKQSEISWGSRQVLMESLRSFYEKKLKDKTVCAYFSEGGEMSAQKGSEVLTSCLYGEGLWNKLADMLSEAVVVLERQREKTLGDFFAQMVSDHGGDVLSGVPETVRDDIRAAGFDRLFEEKEPAVCACLLAMIKDALQKYLEKNEERLVDKLDLEVQNMMSDMAEGMPLGGMAASMLGTRQIIAKVVHRALIEPQPLEAENQWTYEEETNPQEIICRQRLLEELVDRNEEMLLAKIGEIIRRQMEMRTAGELWELLGMGEETVRGQWSRHICQMLSGAWQQGKEQSMAAVEALFGDIVSFAGGCTVEAYLGLLRKEFVKETLEKALLSEVLFAVQKPSVGAACRDFFRYGMDSLLSMPCDTVLSVVTKPVLADALNVCWKRLCSLPCVDSLCSEVLTAKHIECRGDGSDSMSVLLKEALNALWQKENVWEASKECLDGGIGILLECLEDGQEKKEGEHSDVETDRLQRVFMEILGSLEEALRYDNTDRAGLADVAGQIDFERIIRLAVMDMTDAQMEALFQGFAGRYFLSLKLSGALGFVFGVPVLKYAAAVVALGSEFTGKRKE